MSDKTPEPLSYEDVEDMDRYAVERIGTLHEYTTDVIKLAREVRRLRAERDEYERYGDVASAKVEILRKSSPRDAVVLADVYAQLRIACEDIGDNSWEDKLHPADVIEKYLVRPVMHAHGMLEAERDNLQFGIDQFRSALLESERGAVEAHALVVRLRALLRKVYERGPDESDTRADGVECAYCGAPWTLQLGDAAYIHEPECPWPAIAAEVEPRS